MVHRTREISTGEGGFTRRAEGVNGGEDLIVARERVQRFRGSGQVIQGKVGTLLLGRCGGKVAKEWLI